MRMRAAQDSSDLTRGFLFSDLRGYTDFVDAEGDRAAADLLDIYRRLVRDVARRHRGAEIKTEGDSFYLVLPSASGALRCALDITAAAAAASEAKPSRPIRVGIGVHAGEAAQAEGQFVGLAVNTAARICALADAGEVLASEIVRALTRSGRDFGFVARGSQQLKGIAEPVAIYRVERIGPATAEAAAPIRIGPIARSTSALVAGVAFVVLVIGLGLYSLSAFGDSGRLIASPVASPIASDGAIASSAATPSRPASPTPSRSPQPSLSAREQQVLPFIPPQYLAGCGPGVGLAGRAQVACDVPEVGKVTYILYDSSAAMIADYEARYSLMDLNAEGIPTCHEGPYNRPYAGDTRVQAGRKVCFINAAIPHVAWSDEDLGMITVANSPSGEMTLEGLFRWWEQREAGPFPDA